MYWLLWWSYERYFQLRCTTQREHAVQNYSIMISEMRLKNNHSLEKHFDRIFPDQIVSSHHAYVSDQDKSSSEQQEYFKYRLTKAKVIYLFLLVVIIITSFLLFLLNI